MELWDLLDGMGNKLNKTIIRGEELQEGEFHLAVHIWIVNDNKEFLIQKRADNLKHLPGVWAVTGGSVLAGEDSLTAALREVKEEIGINIDSERIKMLFRIKKKDHFADVWIIRKNVALNELEIQVEEVSLAKWVSKEELSDMIYTGVFHNYGHDYFEAIFREYKAL